MAHEPHIVAAPSAVYSTRRDFLRQTGAGFGMLALTALLDQQTLLADPIENRKSPYGPVPGKIENPMSPRPKHFPAKARSVIWLFMNGGPSQVDTWDYKPELAKHDKQDLKGFDQNT